MSEAQADVDDMARVLMTAWEHAEGKPVSASHVATFAGMARAALVDHEAQIRDLLEEREVLLTEIRRLRMGNHPAGRALERTVLRARLGCVDDNVIALQAALTERDAGHEGGGGA